MNKACTNNDNINLSLKDVHPSHANV